MPKAIFPRDHEHLIDEVVAARRMADHTDPLVVRAPHLQHWHAEQDAENDAAEHEGRKPKRLPYSGQKPQFYACLNEFRWLLTKEMVKTVKATGAPEELARALR